VLSHWGHFYRGRILERFRQEEDAGKAYLQALQSNPRFARAASALARLHAARQQYPEAERWLLEASRLDSKNGKILFNLGFVRDRMGEPERAIEAFSEAVRLDPGLDRAWYGMGLCYATLGRHEQAAKALEEAATRQPRNAFAWYQLGMAYHVLRQPDKVKEVIEHMFRFDPRMTRKLIRDTDRSDLAYLVKDLAE
jgi:tetratricopeptide (TPR) repeat protein